MGEGFWKLMIDFVVESMHREDTAKPGEVEVEISDSPTETADYIRGKIRQAQT